jgi:hypothetical protein
MPDYPPESVSLSLLYPHRHLLPAKVRAFADFMVEHMKGSAGGLTVVDRAEPTAPAGSVGGAHPLRAVSNIL